MADYFVPEDVKKKRIADSQLPPQPSVAPVDRSASAFLPARFPSYDTSMSSALGVQQPMRNISIPPDQGNIARATTTANNAVGYYNDFMNTGHNVPTMPTMPTTPSLADTTKTAGLPSNVHPDSYAKTLTGILDKFMKTGNTSQLPSPGGLSGAQLAPGTGYMYTTDPVSGKPLSYQTLAETMKGASQYLPSGGAGGGGVQNDAWGNPIRPPDANLSPTSSMSSPRWTGGRPETPDTSGLMSMVQQLIGQAMDRGTKRSQRGAAAQMANGMLDYISKIHQINAGLYGTDTTAGTTTRGQDLTHEVGMTNAQTSQGHLGLEQQYFPYKAAESDRRTNEPARFSVPWGEKTGTFDWTPKGGYNMLTSGGVPKGENEANKDYRQFVGTAYGKGIENQVPVEDINKYLPEYRKQIQRGPGFPVVAPGEPANYEKFRMAVIQQGGGSLSEDEIKRQFNSAHGSTQQRR